MKYINAESPLFLLCKAIRSRGFFVYQEILYNKKASGYPLAFNDLTGNRTRVYAVRGRRLDRLTIRPYVVCLGCSPLTCIYYHRSNCLSNIFLKKLKKVVRLNCGKRMFSKKQEKRPVGERVFLRRRYFVSYGV